MGVDRLIERFFDEFVEPLIELVFEYRGEFSDKLYVKKTLAYWDRRTRRDLSLTDKAVYSIIDFVERLDLI